MQIFDLVLHKFRINSHWEDYYRFEFYRPEKPWDERCRYVGYNVSRYWPWEGNSLKFDRLFIFKSLQKSILIANDIPTPPVLMKVGRHYAINTVEKFRNAMRNIDRPIMTKFDGGGSGVGIFSLEPDGNAFRCSGRDVDADWIWEQYEEAIGRGFLVEERARNHPIMNAVHPNSMNTLRLTTLKTANGKWHILLPYVKFGRGGSHVDNLVAGGLFTGVDGSGRMGVAYDYSAEEDFERHPDTGAVIKGIQVPFFEEACDLAITASRAFGFMATIAWDVGITPDGPVIIEGNPAWEPQSIQDRLGPFLTQEAAAGIAPRSWWTPWDKTHMYPHYMDHADGSWWQKLLAGRRRQWKSRLLKRDAQQLKQAPIVSE